MRYINSLPFKGLRYILSNKLYLRDYTSSYIYIYFLMSAVKVKHYVVFQFNDGDWSVWAQCPTGSAVCGLQVR